ncbi:hypothetical protein OESDEN_07941 [Oesophagostomum dentatum]|uniref:Uncharacterized protein n=1 Tax=Oesophagostomum dentatum TaxID=61180 RepID=A0A0B1T3R2_OESDE|nr:hypothetical protein OESDEN_07941 [Oesophagostomum dentatum]
MYALIPSSISLANESTEHIQETLEGIAEQDEHIEEKGSRATSPSNLAMHYKLPPLKNLSIEDQTDLNTSETMREIWYRTRRRGDATATATRANQIPSGTLHAETGTPSSSAENPTQIQTIKRNVDPATNTAILNAHSVSTSAESTEATQALTVAGLETKKQEK